MSHTHNSSNRCFQLIPISKIEIPFCGVTLINGKIIHVGCDRTIVDFSVERRNEKQTEKIAYSIVGEYFFRFLQWKKIYIRTFVPFIPFPIIVQTNTWKPSLFFFCKWNIWLVVFAFFRLLEYQKKNDRNPGIVHNHDFVSLIYFQLSERNWWPQLRRKK